MSPEPLERIPGPADIASHLAAIVEASEDAIISKTLDGRIVTWNRAAERIYGYSEVEARGRLMRFLLPPDRPDEEREILERIRRGARTETCETTAAQGIVRSHRGMLKVDSQPGIGSTFKVLFPATEKQPAASAGQPAAEALTGDGEVEAVHRFSGKGLAGFIQKPYSAADLAKKVKETLQESDSEASHRPKG